MSSSGNRTILQPRSRLSVGGSNRKPSGGSSHTQQASPHLRSSVQRVESPLLPDRPYEEQQRIHNAAMMREENELLVWTSLDRNESLPQTKLHYERDMLFIDSDAEGVDDGGDQDDDDSGGSGSIEWEETLEWDEDDHQRMKPGVIFGPGGWWDPKVHKSAQERLEAERERRVRESVRSGKIKAEEASPMRSPPNRRRSSGIGSSNSSTGGTPGRRRASGGKRAFGAGGSSQG